MLKAYSGEDPNEDIASTIGLDYKKSDYFAKDGLEYAVKIWDTAG